MDINGMSDQHVQIELRRPSGPITRDPEKLQELDDRGHEMREQRRNEWLGRVSQVLGRR